MKADFTLVPIGGLGNRIYAICSAIVYCTQQNKSLEIIWFKDHGCNCPVKELFSINPELKNVTLRGATLADHIFRDNPRRRNFWVPAFFQRFNYDRRIYTEEACDVMSYYKKPDFGNIDIYKHIFMVSHYKFWESPEMWKSIVINKEIDTMSNEIINKLRTHRKIGIHIRRTDNIFSVKESPTGLFIEKIKEEIQSADGDVSFYLASDSLEIKREFKQLFNDRIIMSAHESSRDNKQGIIEAFVELITLSKTKKIYASYNSSFSELAHFLGNNDFEILKK